MKLLSIFLILLISIQITKSTDSLANINFNSFSDNNMIRTPDTGVFVDTDPNNFFYDKINFPVKYYGRYERGSHYVQGLNHKLVIDKPMARLKITYQLSDAQYWYYYWGYHEFIINFGDKKLAIGKSHMFHWFYNNQRYYQDGKKIIYGYVYNVQPGVHEIKLRFEALNTYYRYPVIGRLTKARNSLTIEGEFLGNSGYGNRIITPKEQSTPVRKFANSFVTGDYYLYYNYVDWSYQVMHDTDNNYKRYYWNKKAMIRSHFEEGSNLYFLMYSYRSKKEGLIGRFAFYDRFGVLQTFGTNTSKWWCNKNNWYYKNKAYHGYFSSSYHSQMKKLRPGDEKGDDLIHATSGNNSTRGYYYCGREVPTSRRFKSVIYAAPYGTLTQIKINSKKYTYNRDWNTITRLQKNLKSGDKITFKTSRSSHAGVAAVIYYKNKEKKVVELTTDRLMKCTKSWSKVRKTNNPRNGGILAALVPNLSYYIRTHNKKAECHITLP